MPGQMLLDRHRHQIAEISRRYCVELDRNVTEAL